MIHQSWEFGKAIRPLFAEPVTYYEMNTWVEQDAIL